MYTDERMKDKLIAMAAEMGCTEAEAAREAVWQYYEAAGYTSERIAAEFGSMSDEDILDAVYNL